MIFHIKFWFKYTKQKIIKKNNIFKKIQKKFINTYIIHGIRMKLYNYNTINDMTITVTYTDFVIEQNKNKNNNSITHKY